MIRVRQGRLEPHDAPVGGGTTVNNRTVQSTLLALLASAAGLLLAAPAGAVTFGSFESSTLAGGAEPSIVETGDFNGDGIPDVVAGSESEGSVRVMLGSTSGALTEGPKVSASGVRALAVGDIDRDGRPDVVGAGINGQVWYGNGTSTLTSGTGFSLGGTPTSVTLADVTQDGRLDIVVGLTNGSAYVYVAQTGGFGPGTPVPLAGHAGSSVVVTDLDRDGRLDLVQGHTDGPDLRVTRGNGPNSWLAPTTVSTTGATSTLTAGDVNRDGKVDLVVGTPLSTTAQVLPGNGDATFGTPIAVTLPRVPMGLELVDLDRDGRLDLGATGPSGVAVLHGNGDGTFAASVDVATFNDPLSLAFADFDRDGRPDLVTARAVGFSVDVALNTTAITPANVRSTVTPQPATGNGPADTVVADVNRDGIPDLVVAEQTASRVAIFIGVGDGTYASRVEYWPGGSSPTHPVVADMNRDGIPDIVVGNALSASVSVMLGNGDGTFKEGAAANVSALGTFNGPQGVVVGDFNRDGKPDVAVSTGTDGQKVLVLLGNGDGTLGAPASISIGANLPDLAVGDLNNDGKPDLVAAGYTGTGRAYVLMGNGDGTFAATVQYTTGAGTWAVRLADLDRDGDLDLVTANLSNSSVAVLKNNGNGTFASRTETTVGSGPRGLAVEDVDGDGKLDVVETWQSGTGLGILLGGGDGSLGAEAVTTIGSDTYGVAVGDLNRDGRMDIAAPSYTGQKLYVLLAGVDATAPTTTDNVPAWATATPFRPTLTATDAGGSAVSKTYYEVGSPAATPTTSSAVYNSASKPSMTDGQQIRYFSVDTAGNAEAVKTSGTVRIDTVRPTTSDDVPTAWQKTAPAITLTAADTGGSGVDKTYYTIGTNPSTPNTSSAVYNPAAKPTLANGQKIRYFTRDVAGNSETSKTSAAAKVDTVAPTTSASAVTGWHTTPVTVTLTPADTGGSGLDKTYYEIGTSPGTPTTASAVYSAAAKPVLQHGEKIAYLSVDVAGNVEAVKTSAAAQVDGTAPTTTDDVPGGWRSGPVSVTLAAGDGSDGSGVDKTYYEIGTSPATPTTASAVYDAGSKPVLADGQRISYFSVDVAGNVEVVKTSGAAQVDTAAPTTTDDVPGGWRTAPVSVTLTAGDGAGGSGVDKTYYEIGSSPATPTTSSAVYDAGSKPVLADGQKISYFSVDVAGNAETPHTSVAAQVDTAAPTTTDDVPTGWQSAPVSITLTATDGAGGSGVDKTYYEIGSSPATPTTSSAVYDPAAKPVLQDGERIAYLSVDVAGNAETPHTSAAVQVDVGVPDTTLTEAPADPTSDPRPAVAFTSTAADATFECAVDGEPFAACTSPFRPADPLADGPHAVRVRAVSRAGLVDPTPASASFTVDTTAPAPPTPLAEPPASSPATTVSIAFDGADGATFTCRVDGGPAGPCASPLTLTELAVGDHVVAVVQTDAAGNASDPLVIRFTVTKPADPPPGEDPPVQDDPTRLLTELGAPDGSGRRPAILIAGVSGIACRADRGTIARCALEARSLRSLLLANGRRLPAGSVLAKGATAAGVAPGRALAAKLVLTAAGRSALARHPLGMTARLVLNSALPSGRAVTGSTRVRLMASDTLVLPFAGRGAALPRDVRGMLDRLVRTVSPAKAVRCTADTDASGNAAADRALTRRQATAACAYLKARGLRSRLTAEGRGSTRPRASNRTARGRALNRRLTIKITL